MFILGAALALTGVYFVIPPYIQADNSWPSFPSCTGSNIGNVIADYSDGDHAIPGVEGLQSGTDAVYSLSDGNAVQCFCPPTGSGIQTNWWKTESSPGDGWIEESGAGWGLDNATYFAQNSNFTCGGSSPSVTPTAAPIPTPTPVITSAQETCTGDCGNPPSFAGSSTNAPVCSDGNTVQLPANPFVERKGSEATVNFFITEGDSANIYYRLVGQSDWQYSVLDLKPNSDRFVSVKIQDLDANAGYDFAIQQKQGCGGGQLVNAVIIDGPEAQTFKFSYWEWSK